MIIDIRCIAANTRLMKKKICYICEDEVRSSKDECPRCGYPFVTVKIERGSIIPMIVANLTAVGACLAMVAYAA